MIEIQSEKLNLRTMQWVSICCWGDLCPTKIGAFGVQYVTKEDIFRFYDTVVRSIARKVNQDYDEVKKIIDAENTPFIEYVHEIFKNKKMYRIESEQLYRLRRMFLAPLTDATAESLLRLYYDLPYDEREKFKKRIESN